MRNVVFIVQQLSQPRCVKRIEEFNDFGFRKRVFGFDNGLYSGNLENLNYHIEKIWKIKREYSQLRKFREYFKFIQFVKKEVKKEDIIYAFGFELGLLISFLRPYNFIYEEADVSAARYKNFLLKKILIYLDKRIIRKSRLTIHTSEGFQKYLFGNDPSYRDKIVYAHNKLHRSFLKKERPKIKKININSLNFGFIGLVRYPNTILRFAKVIGECFPQHNFHFYGEAGGDILNKVEWSNYNNVFFYGKFRNPEDLNKIYSDIDINIVCYDTTSDNVKIAEPNKLYESIYFKKPIVVSKDTFVGEKVRELNIGFVINAENDNSIVDFIKRLEVDELKTVQENCNKIAVGDLVTNSTYLMNKVKSAIMPKTDHY